MVDIPQQEQLTPEEAFAQLQAWFVEKDELNKAKFKEHETRTRLAAYYFTAPVEGTNRLDLGGGYDLVLQHKFNYKVDEGELDNVKAADIKKLKLPWDDLFEYKPSLKLSVYRDLTKEQKLFVDQLLNITDASPQLEIKPSANREGQAAHVAEAEAKSTASTYFDTKAGRFVVVLKAEDAEQGQFYTDGEGNWWVLNSGDWEEVGEEVVDEDGDNVIQLLNRSHELTLAAQAAAKPKRGRGRAKKEAK